MQDKLNILIVEDEVLISERLKQIVNGFGHTVIGICNSLESVLKMKDDIQSDLALLDIRLNGVDEGIEIARLLKGRDIPFVFITSFSDKKMLQEAIEQRPIGYITKPFSKNEIQKTFATFLAERETEFLEIISGNKFEKIRLKDIKWINSENVYVEVHCVSKKILIRKKLSEIEVLVPPAKFIRIHQSYIINIAFITKYQGNKVWVDDTSFPVSRKFKTNLLTITNFLQA